jgi:predicted Zn-dependent protease
VSLLVNRYLLAFLKRDTAEMTSLLASAAHKPGAEHLMLACHSDTEAWYGRLASARDLTRRATEAASAEDAKETAATYQSEAALREAELLNHPEARARVESALKLSDNRDVRSIAALALARVGESARAEKLIADLNREFPLDTLVQRYWLPTIQAAVELERGKPNKAIDLLKITTSYELGQPTSTVVVLSPVYVRGQAYLMLRNGALAVAESHKILDHPGIVGNFVIGSLAHLQLARAFALQGANAKAKAAYQDFLTLWKDADPDIPVLKQAKAEYAKLE